MADGPIYMDLPDFIPENFDFSLSISGHRYRFQYPEATVDEVLKMLWAAADQEDHISKVRRVVGDFLSAHVSEGDDKQLIEDLKLLPYKSTRGGLDVSTLFERMQTAIKKKEIG